MKQKQNKMHKNRICCSKTDMYHHEIYLLLVMGNAYRYVEKLQFLIDIVIFQRYWWPLYSIHVHHKMPLLSTTVHEIFGVVVIWSLWYKPMHNIVILYHIVILVVMIHDISFLCIAHHYPLYSNLFNIGTWRPHPVRNIYTFLTFLRYSMVVLHQFA